MNTYSPEQFGFLKLARRVFRNCSILHRTGFTDNGQETTMIRLCAALE